MTVSEGEALISRYKVIKSESGKPEYIEIELADWMFREITEGNMLHWSGDANVEMQADEFASHLLMPLTHFRDGLGDGAVDFDHSWVTRAIPSASRSPPLPSAG